ncbi:unnamed protein product [Adineta ricciae]|uniref:G-protein coupled receptors family 1 profile domain-containing protein n=1 Tax=Adineta ricciae TaxID=249248 RepID=A0A814G0L1_ADIRI|nr:unnamed protein product [Adineta ricciae]
MSTNTDNHSTVNVRSLAISMSDFYSILFSIYLLLIIPSISCSLFALYHFLYDRNLRQALHNHIIIVLLILNLIYELTVMICMIHYFRNFQTFPPSVTFHVIYGYFDWTFYIVESILYAWVTIERHVLIFHDKLIATKTKRILIHYFPPVFIIVYCFVYHGIVFFFWPCANNNKTISSIFFTPCAFQNSSLFLYEMITHYVSPILIIVISSCTLLVRVIWRKYQVQRRISWSRYRKMAVQVLTISCLYVIFIFPYIFMNFLYICGVPVDMENDFFLVAPYLAYFTFLLFPVVAVGSLPEFRGKFKDILPCFGQRRVIRPINLTTFRTANNQLPTNQ